MSGCFLLQITAPVIWTSIVAWQDGAAHRARCILSFLGAACCKQYANSVGFQAYIACSLTGMLQERSLLAKNAASRQTKDIVALTWTCRGAAFHKHEVKISFI